MGNLYQHYVKKRKEFYLSAVDLLLSNQETAQFEEWEQIFPTCEVIQDRMGITEVYLARV